MLACVNFGAQRKGRQYRVQALNLLSRGSRFLCGLISFYLFLTSCSTRVSIPTVSDDAVELLVRNEAAQIVAVSEDKDRFSDYQIYLSDFPRNDILGMSIGNRRIYISHRLAKFASTSSLHLWLLRQTLAHEIAHETAGHATDDGSTWFNRSMAGRGVSSADVGLPWNVRLRNYSTDKELEADAKGLGYWKMLGWDCGIWVRILQTFEKQNYVGDDFHPTDQRLRQAQRLCSSEQKPGVI
jgi:predicted Zn-dependent protease